MDQANLHRLLDANLRLPPEYRDQLTNHLPMALQALHAMGASEQRLDDFFAVYAQRFVGLEAVPDASPVADWCALRGTSDGFAALRATFVRALAGKGRDTVLREALPHLLPGVAAAAFHGLIRTAHAIEAGHDGELAAALAYWAWRWQALALPPIQAPLEFDEWANELTAQAADWTCEGPLISIRMGIAAASAPYRALAGRLAASHDLLPRLADFAARRYALTANFTVLHLVTGVRAFRVVSPWLDDVAAAKLLLVHAFTAAYLAARVDLRAEPILPPALTWPEVIAAATASDDDHLVKLVHACREEQAAYGNAATLAAARRAVAPARLRADTAP